jgi:outer membrane receptor protein involved in Fe transport
MRFSSPWLAVALSISATAFGQATTQPTTTQPVASQSSTLSAPVSGHLGNVVVTSNLDVARDQIAPPLGAQTYTIGPSQIQNTPEGENASFQQVLLRAPGVVEDSFGQEHVRGEHANLTYRVNGVILPEPLSGFAQELDSHLIQSVTLIDGTLPAQFGLHTAGIIDVTTKSGTSLQNNEVSIYGGSYDTIEPSFEFGGTSASGKWDYFIASSYTHDQLGIENATPNIRADHDITDQEKNFDYLSFNIDDTSRISFLGNMSFANFEIPNVPGLSPQFPLAGSSFDDSEKIDENQNEQNYYAVLSYQKSVQDLSFQASVFSSYGQIHFTPDNVGDLVFQGVSGEVLNNSLDNGVQIDAADTVNKDHTVRFGFIGDYNDESLNTNTLVFPVDPTTGLQSSTTPLDISDNSGNEATTAGIYAQDEWRINRQLTVNYGARFDTYNSNFDKENQLSPRVNFVYKSDPTTTIHWGYARYFVPPPLQDVPPDSVDKQANTSNAPSNFLDDPVKVERSNYYDAGISHFFLPTWQVSGDGFYKAARNLVDEGQFGDAVIETPFNYARGYVYGAELSSTYKYDNLSLFGNFSWVETRARDINSQQFTIDSDELAFIDDHYIRLDHEGNFTGSAGIAYNLTRDDLLTLDMLYGSGLRKGFANDAKEPEYAPVNLGYQHTFHIYGSNQNLLKFRFDVVNLFDESYQLRSGTGIGVGAPQYGERRGFFAGVAYDF